MELDLGAVRHLKGDRLGRRRFAEALADYIDGIGGKDDGFVIGLEGSWGSGKSSVVNMVLEELLHISIAELSKQPRFLDDSGTLLTRKRLADLAPLHFRTTYDPLTVDLAYFTADVVNRRYSDRAATDVGLSADLYRYFRLARLAPESTRNLTVVFQPWLIPESAELASVFVRELTRAIGDRLGQEIAKTLDDYRAAIEEIAPIAGVAIDTIVPGASRYLRAFLQPNNAARVRTLEERKTDLEAALRKLTHRKILVVIDDLDRLTPKEAAEMVGLVKGLGRLPNVVYLLSYDETNLARLIGNALQVDGHEFLEKIVQYKRQLPLLPPRAMDNLIEDTISGISPPITGESLTRMQEAWTDVVLKRLRTPRDAIRLGNSFRTGWNSVGRYLDGADFLVLQFISQKDTALYNWIRNNLRLLCGLDASLRSEEVSKAIQAFGVEADTPRARMLASLFPKAAEVLGTYGSSGLRTARQDRRLHTFDYRRAYFDLVPPEDTISAFEFSEFVNEANPSDKLAEFLTSAANSAGGSSIRANLLDDLRHYYGDGVPIPMNMALALVDHSPVLINAGDEENVAFYNESNLSRLESILFRGLDAHSPRDRAPLLLFLIQRAQDLSLVSAVTRTALGPVEATRRDRQTMTMEGRENEVREKLLKRIVALASQKRLFEQAVPSSLIWFWYDSGNHEQVRNFVTQSARSLHFFPKVIELVTSRVRSSAPPYTYETTPKWMEEIVDLNMLRRLAERMSGSSRESVRAAAERYFKARKTDDSGEDANELSGVGE